MTEGTISLSRVSIPFHNWCIFLRRLKFYGMKRFTVILAGFLAFAFSLSADNDRAISVDKLPAQAREFIMEHFASEKIAYVKQERDFFEVNYEVMFVGGALVEFDRRGAWTEIECRYKIIPENVIPPAIAAYVSENWPGQPYRKISRDRNEYEVKLASGLELTFDRYFNLMGIDD